MKKKVILSAFLAGVMSLSGCGGNEEIFSTTEGLVGIESGFEENSVDDSANTILVKCDTNGLTNEEIGSVTFVLAEADENGEVINIDGQPTIKSYDLNAENGYEISVSLEENKYYSVYRMLLGDNIIQKGFPTIITSETESFTFSLFRKNALAAHITETEQAIDFEAFVDENAHFDGLAGEFYDKILTLEGEERNIAAKAFDGEYINKFSSWQWQKAARYMLAIRNEHLDEEFRENYFKNDSAYYTISSGGYMWEVLSEPFLQRNTLGELEKMVVEDLILWKHTSWIFCYNDLSEYGNDLYMHLKWKGDFSFNDPMSKTFWDYFKLGGLNDENAWEKSEYIREAYEFIFKTYQETGEPIDIWLAEKYYNLGLLELEETLLERIEAGAAKTGYELTEIEINRLNNEEYFNKFTDEQWKKAGEYMITLRNEYMDEEFREKYSERNLEYVPCADNAVGALAEIYKEHFSYHNSAKEWDELSQNERVLWYYSTYVPVYSSYKSVYESASLNEFLKGKDLFKAYEGRGLYKNYCFYGENDNQAEAAEFEPVENYLCEIYEFVYSTYETAGEPIDIWVAEKYYNLGFFE